MPTLGLLDSAEEKQPFNQKKPKGKWDSLKRGRALSKD